MFRKNVAGQVIYGTLIDTNGVAVTAGAGIDVSKDGGAAAGGAGTLAHISNGLWAYTFTQAEINAIAVGWVFYKAGAVPQGGSLRTTAANPDSATDFGIGNLDVATSSRSTYAGADTSGTGTLLGRLTTQRATNLDNLDAPVSSRLATAGVPTNFASLAITVGGAVTVGTVNDKAGYTLATAPPTLAQIVNGVWDEPQSGHATAGTFGSRIDAAITTRSTYAGGAVASVTAAVTLPTSPPAGYGGGTAPTPEQIVAAIDASSTRLANLTTIVGALGEPFIGAVVSATPGANGQIVATGSNLPDQSGAFTSATLPHRIRFLTGALKGQWFQVSNDTRNSGAQTTSFVVAGLPGGATTDDEFVIY